MPEPEWEAITEGLGTTEEPYWWHVDNHNAISHDGGKTYYMIDEPLEGDGAPRIYSTIQRPVVHRDYPKDLEQAVTFAVGHGSVCWTPMDGTGVFDDVEARRAVDALVEWVNEHYTKKENTSA